MTTDVALEMCAGYVSRVDELAPSLVEGFYIVGSTALGGFRSDIDFVAVVSRPPTEREVDAIRRWRRAEHRRALVRAVPRLAWPLVCNGFYMRADDVERDPSTIVPLFNHTSGSFQLGRAFDANPVTWWILANHGVSLRGPEPLKMRVWRDDVAMKQWVLDNMNHYWARWARAIRKPSVAAARACIQHMGAPWGVLGVARMHCTITTGAVITKAAAGEYALQTFAGRWHPIVEEAVSYWKGRGRSLAPRPSLRVPSAEFVEMVIDVTNEFAAADSRLAPSR